MDVAVLSPQDCLKNPLKTKPAPRSSRSHHPNRRKNNSSPPKKPNQLVMGQVKILKRGESVDAPSFNQNNPDLTRNEPTQRRVEKQSKGNGFYAGSAFVTSPPPSSLPLPAFMKKSVANIVDDDASSYLMKILGINLI